VLTALANSITSGCFLFGRHQGGELLHSYKYVTVKSNALSPTK